MAGTTDTSKASTFSSSLQLHDIADITRVFHKFDANSDGKISAGELSNVILSLNSSTSPDEITAIMTEIDADRDGFISLEEFAGFIASGTENVEGELKEAFELYDINKNGLISSSELGEILTRIGESVTEKDCVKMIESVDEDGDGFVNFEEFRTMMSRSNSNCNNSPSVS
ncbi:Calcium-binding protein CML24 [Heracleum sosnowskyi]|uniref:Calcium-binding protein CML24 n=1 Tax=Heracleum sosnowskyi TaxID=360622 RepID=A0AAD8HS73_9APIA|nr:Calcium-binding protein CML24 [Heracleum sosnowskyi]